MSMSDVIAIFGIIASITVAILIYLLQSRLTDKQKIENRLDLEKKLKQKLYHIHYDKHSSKVQLYNSKLIGKKNFANNKRTILWGYPFHAAELYQLNFDGIELVTDMIELDGEKYYKVGLIPYENVLGLSLDGDGSFNGYIFYVKPRLIQLNRYSIAYSRFRYYPVKEEGKDC